MSLRDLSLGLRYFYFFINDLPLITKVCFCDFYADDATFHTHGDNLETIEHSLQTDGNIAKTWGKGNKMHIHYTLCKTDMHGCRKKT